MIITRYIECDLGKKIHLFDGLVSLEDRMFAYTFCKNSKFNIGWADSIEPEKQSKNLYLHSSFTVDEVKKSQILKYMDYPEIANLIKDYELHHTVLNLSTAADCHYTHVHVGEIVILYYVNLSWEDGFHGETLFYSEDLKDIQFATPYTPGRLIVFDGNIPHCIRPQSVIAPSFRFTLALCYKKKTETQSIK